MNWIEQVTILDLLVKGLIVGVVVSAPLGPVGVLCIQRTLNKGRWYGFVTGLGAALSDIGYALITGYGMSFMDDFLAKNQVLSAASKASASKLFVEVFPLVPTVMTEPCAHLPRSSSSSDGSMASAIFPGRLAAGRLAT